MHGFRVGLGGRNFGVPGVSWEATVPPLSPLPLARCSFAGYNNPGFENSVGVMFRASPSPCIALVTGGNNPGDNCAFSNTAAPLSASQVCL